MSQQQSFSHHRPDKLGAELCSAFLAAEIPINKMDCSPLKAFLERGLGITLSSQLVFRNKHIPACYNEVLGRIQEALRNSPVWLSTDCSRDSLAREFTKVLVGRLDKESTTHLTL